MSDLIKKDINRHSKATLPINDINDNTTINDKENNKMVQHPKT